jgi:hypothetical protein
VERLKVIVLDVLFMPGVGLEKVIVMRFHMLKKIPSKALTRAWEIDETDGEIYAWFDKNASPSDPNGQRFK